jgi:predicted Zn-dependent peptidase
MDEKQQRQVNEAAEKFAEAIKESYQALADRSVSAQELNAQLKQQEASQALTQESVNAYMDFLGSMFAYYRGSLDEAQRGARK